MKKDLQIYHFTLKAKSASNNLRPKNFQNYIGQEKLKEIQIYIKAAKLRDEPLDHILLYGPPWIWVKHR